MAQHDYVIANGTGAAVRSDLNNALAAIVSQNSGATEPATMYAYQWWADTTTGLLKLRNGANNAWITLRELDGTLTIEDGTAGSPGLAFADDLNTGVFSPGADQVAFTAGGTARLTATTTGITSALPVDVPLGSASAPTVTFTGDLNTGIYSPGADQVAVATNGAERLRIGASGQIGLAGANYGTSGQVITSNGSGSAPTWQTISSSQWTTTGSDIYYTTGKVGIGTQSPGSALAVVGDIRLQRSSVTGLDKYAFYYNGVEFGYTGVDTTNGHLTINATSGYPIRFQPNNTEAARFDTSGRLLVGTSTASRPTLVQIVQANQTPTSGNGNLGIYTSDTQAANIGAKLALGGQSGEANWLYASLSGRSENNSYAGYLQFNTSDAAGNHDEAARINSGKELLIGYTTDNGAYKLQVNSQIFATSATIATSDGRYKENVATLNGCVDLVKALRPVSFTWKPQEDITRTDEKGNEVLVREGHNFPDGTQVGFIAQEVQEVLAEKPWLTSVIKENVRSAVTDDDGNELAPEEEFLGIAEGNLIAVLTSALQEAIAKIETLEARLTALEAA